MGASTRGIALGSPHSSVRLHTSVWEKSPPLRRSSADSSKQHLQGFCTTTGTFLPPTERSDRGNTSVGHRTRVLQPLLPCSKKGWRPEAHSGSAVSEFFPLQREVQDADDENHHVSDSRRRLVCHYRPKGCIFHIQVVQWHRKFLRFAFGGKAYQYKILPFGLALAPRMFTKCMDAALAPLRLQGIRVLNYLDDWLILAHSRELVSRHRDIVLRHIHSLGLRMNAKKSVLLPSQRTMFLGVHLDSIQMQACLAPARISNFTACLARFKLGRRCLCRYLPQAVRPHGSGLSCVAPRVASHEAVPLVDERAEITPHLYQPLSLSGCRVVALNPFYNGGTPLFFRTGSEWVRSTVTIWSRWTHQWRAGSCNGHCSSERAGWDPPGETSDGLHLYAWRQTA